MNLIVEMVLESLLPDGRRRPHVDPVTFVVAVLLGGLAGHAMYRDLLDSNAMALAWLAIPAAGTVLVGTLLRRRQLGRGAALAVAMAVAVALPLALFDMMFGFWL